MKGLHMLAWILVIIGGLLWGVYGIFGGWEISSLFGTTLADIIYILVGLSAIYEICTHKKNCKTCNTNKDMGSMNKPMGGGTGQM